MPHIHDFIEIRNTKIGIVCLAVKPNAPYEKRIDNFGVRFNIFLEGKDFTIVESYRNSNIMETGSITLEILYCIYVSMEHIGIADNLSGHLVSSLQKIVIICVNAGYHAISHITTQ